MIDERHSSQRYLRALSDYMEKSGASAATIAERIGVSVRTVQRWLAGDTGIPHKHFPALRTFADPEKAVTIPSQVDSSRIVPAHRLKVYPVITSAYCAEHGISPAVYYEITEDTFDGEWIALQDKGRSLMVFRAAGESMLPTITEGDCLAVDLHTELRLCLGKVVACLHLDDGDDEHLVIKRLSEDGERVILTSDNPTHPPLNLPRNRVKFIWRVVEVIRSM